MYAQMKNESRAPVKWIQGILTDSGYFVEYSSGAYPMPDEAAPIPPGARRVYHEGS